MNRPYPVNWTDGMNVRQAHLMQSDQAATRLATLAASAALSQARYGLCRREEQPTLEMTERPGEGGVVLTVRQAAGFCAAGLWMEVSPAVHPQGLSVLVSRAALNEGSAGSPSTVLAVLSVHPTRFVPSGALMPDEARQPFLVPELTLSVLPGYSEHFHPGAYGIALAEFKVQSDALFRDEDYVPAHLAISDSKVLAEWWATLQGELGALRAMASQAIDSAYQVAQISDLSYQFADWAQTLLQAESSARGAWRAADHHATPIDALASLVTFFSKVGDAFYKFSPDIRAKLHTLFDGAAAGQTGSAVGLAATLGQLSALTLRLHALRPAMRATTQGVKVLQTAIRNALDRKFSSRSYYTGDERGQTPPAQPFGPQPNPHQGQQPHSPVMPGQGMWLGG